MRDVRKKRDPCDPASRLRATTDAGQPAQRAEALAIHQEWTERFVEGMNLCPFARTSRVQRRSDVHLWFGAVPLDPDQVDPAGELASFFVDVLARDDAEVVQVVFPGLRVDALAWEKVAKAFHAQLRPLHRGTGWAVAAFHPAAAFGVASAAALVPLFRRAPFPTIQWLRLDALARVREGRDDHDRYVAPGTPEFLELFLRPPRPGIAKVVAEANERTAERFGLDALVAALRRLAVRAELCYPTSDYPWCENRPGSTQPNGRSDGPHETGSDTVCVAESKEEGSR